MIVIHLSEGGVPQVELLTYTTQASYNVTMRGIRVTFAAVEKQYVVHTLSVCLQPYVTSKQCPVSSVACPVLQSFSTLCHKRQAFSEIKVTKQKHIF